MNSDSLICNFRQNRVVTTVSQLRDRWRGSAQELAHEAAARLVTGRPLDGLGLDNVDGRVDLRGLWVASTRGLPGIAKGDPVATTPTARKVTWKSIDLSHSTMRIDLVDARVGNVLFARVGWRNWRATSSTFHDCSFVGADVRDACWDGYNEGLQGRKVQNRPSHYVRCNFSRTRIGPYGDFGRAELEGCLFEATAFPSPMWFRGAAIRDCEFVGDFRDVNFGWTGPVSEAPPWLDAQIGQANFESLGVFTHSGPGLR